MRALEVEFSNCGGMVASTGYQESLRLAIANEALLREGKVAGNDFLGWRRLPSQAAPIVAQVQDLATRLRTECTCVVVVGIGGSYLGAKALIDALPERLSGPKVLFLGQNICSDYTANLLESLEGEKVGVIAISKSGTTLEPALALRLLLNRVAGLEGGKIPPSRVVAITDAKRGALHDQAVANGWATLVVPDDVGGRYSVLTPVGLLPLLVAGIDIVALLEGARAAEEELCDSKAETPAARYAAYRHYQGQEGHSVEVLATYTPYMREMGEWYKQLFAESEGKEGKGIFPVSVTFSTDLHSLGQFFQEGRRLFFGTHVAFRKALRPVEVPSSDTNGDGLNYLAGKAMPYVCEAAQLATQAAHEQGGMPSVTLWLAERNEQTLGYFIYFFEWACALSCLCHGVNPFDQPGVEAYKKGMFTRLGRP